MAISAAVLAALGGVALAAQDKYPCKCRVPRLLRLRDTKPGRHRRQSERNLIEVILGNPAMIGAYQAGIPATASLSRRRQMARSIGKREECDAPSSATVPGVGRC